MSSKKKTKAQIAAELDTLQKDYAKLMTKVIFQGNEAYRISGVPLSVLGEVYVDILQGQNHQQILKSFSIDSETLGNFEVKGINEINLVTEMPSKIV